MNADELKMLDRKMDEFLEFNHPRSGDYENARYGVVYADGTLYDCDYTYCHGHLSSINEDVEEVWNDDIEDYEYTANGNMDKEILAVVNQIQLPLVEDRHALRYYEWLFNFSPYRLIFPEKDFEKVYERHIFVVDARQPANLMVGGLMASRFPTENYAENNLWRLCKLWNDLVDRDVHPNLAFTVASTMQVSKDFKSIRMIVNGGGHQAVSPTDYAGTHKNFLNDNPTYLTANYSEIGTYDAVNRAWGKFDEEDELNSLLINVIDGVADVEKKANPFGKARGGFGSNDYRGAATEDSDYQLALDPIATLLHQQTPLLLAA